MQIRDFDWSEIISDLHRLGMDRSEICRALNGVVSDSTLRAYVRGVQLQPSHWRGELLIELWCKRTGKARSEAPTRPAHLDNYCERRVTKMRTDLSAMNALDAVFRPRMDMNEIYDRATGKARPRSKKDTRGPVDSFTLPLLGFE